jgi:tRNA threonylcarbamoyl adenosine modification protein YeaZ
MAILAIDTSMAACSAAILRPGTTEPVQRFAPMERGHAEELFAMIEAVMAEADCDFSVITKMAVTLGPGSFTGVRAGIAAARGLALAARLPLVGATSLEVMAHGLLHQRCLAGPAESFAIIHDARREECYMQSFDAAGHALTEPGVFSIPEAANALPEGISLIAGSGAAAVALAAGRQGRELRAELPGLLPEAADLARIALTRGAPAVPPAPLYLRPADAKPQTDKSLARAG